MEWQPIASAPKDGTVVLLWGIDEDEWEEAEDEERDVRRWQVLTGYVSLQKHIWWSAAGGMRIIHSPTHWMPLPPAPQAAETRDG